MAGELLADVQDANVGVYDGAAGDRITVLGPPEAGAEPGTDAGTAEPGGADFVVSGRGRSLPGGEEVQDESVIVLYATAGTVAELSGEAGASELALRLDDPSPAAARRTVDDVRGSLGEVPGFAGFSDLPEVRAPGDWPGRADTESFGRFVSVITVLALFSALVLISNTMSTLVAEQTRQIAVMRAIGGRRRDVARIYLTTTLLLGGVGAIVGVVAGVALSNLLAGYFGRMFWAIHVGWGIDPTVLLASVAVGLLVPMPSPPTCSSAPARSASCAASGPAVATCAASSPPRGSRWPPRGGSWGSRSATCSPGRWYGWCGRSSTCGSPWCSRRCTCSSPWWAPSCWPCSCSSCPSAAPCACVPARRSGTADLRTTGRGPARSAR